MKIKMQIKIQVYNFRLKKLKNNLSKYQWPVVHIVLHRTDSKTPSSFETDEGSELPRFRIDL